nr:hypothetical protein [uncultured Agathobaculum sp.]
MGAMKNYAIGVCDAHPKEMYDLYDLLCDGENVKEAVEMELVERNGGDIYPTQDVSEIMQGIDDILEDVPEEEALIMLEVISLISDKPDAMEEELHWPARGQAAAAADGEKVAQVRRFTPDEMAEIRDSCTIGSITRGCG